ncbi:MAG TPA: Hsp20/alpha crystallin family protein [Phycisphaerae bacterium]|nr:Hsp20/alpha crystallin family protein [Phycisphaerae bacterium]HNU45779.1 Hsp20/alpha crystallin family protein [Phycisphaerae bacterium]
MAARFVPVPNPPACPLAAGEPGFDDLADDVWSMMNEWAQQHFFHAHTPKAWQPRLNLYEMADRYLVCVELAGVQCSDIDVRVDDGVLHVRGVRPRPTPPQEDKSVSVHVMEIDSGRFRRRLSVPADVDLTGITARYHQGYLWITLPRASGPRAAEP